jgi:SAM-dependent methyltransferase
VTRVAEHYRRWPFPGVEHSSREGLRLLRTLGGWLEDGIGTRRILDVGCGTGHTVIALASHFPDSEFLGIDLVAENVASAETRARDAKVDNVSFTQVDLERQIPAAVGRFDVVLCLGVLHHLTDLRAGFDNCCSLLGPDGRLVLWLYGKYGRWRHELNQQLLRVLSDGLSHESQLALARAFAQDLGERFAVDTGFYTPHGCGRDGLAWLLQHPQWLADQMIPALEHSVTLPDILSLFECGDIAFEKWFGVDIEPRSYAKHPLVLAQFERLSPQQRLHAIDLLIKPAYYFIAGMRRGTSR